MNPPRDPDEVEQTLVPGAPAKPAPEAVDTPPHPAGSDATEAPPTGDTAAGAPVPPLRLGQPFVVPMPGGPPAPAASGEETLPSVPVRVPVSVPLRPGRQISIPIRVGPPASPAAAPPAAPAGDTLPSVAVPAPLGRDTVAETPTGGDATLMPSRVIGTAGTVADGSAVDPNMTLPSPPPADRTAVAGASGGPLGDDTAPPSVAGPAGRPPASPSATGTMVGRFALRALHASGGLGEVFTARDTELNREVAVKRIKSQYADDAGSRRRFLTEAELTARLDHPGVVPVFGLVNDVRGRPCYAMRFIRGETLKDEIDRYHAGQGAGDRGQGAEKTEKTEKTGEKADPGLAATPKGAPAGVPQSVAFRHLLARFIATCQAIAYAHSRNIIHRDIKPANIMVGTFGETLVVDWGLAKSLDDGPDFDRLMKAQAEHGFRHDPEATDMPSHMTLAGTAVGTPAYMAPEQAAGEVDKVGIRADVYALGATLFVILTGKAPFSGKTTAEVLDRVRRGTYDPAAVVHPGAPRPLDAIARKAMALRQEDRYATAKELAADVERWLSDEPVSCYRDPLLARAARWGRRHPARVATAVSLLLAGLLAAGGIAYALHLGERKEREEKERTAAERDRAETEKEQKTAALKTVTAQKETIEGQNTEIKDRNAQLTRARNAAADRFERAVDAYNVLVVGIDKKLADNIGMEDLRQGLLRDATDGLNKLIAGGREGQFADRTLVAAYRQMGDVYQRLSDSGKARDSFQLAVDRAADVRREAQKGTAADVRAADLDLARSHARLADAHLNAGDSKKALGAADAAIKLLEPLAADPTDPAAQNQAKEALAAARTRRAAILKERGETGRALEDCDKALTARKALHDAAPTDPDRARDYAAGLDALAGLQLQTGSTADALANANKSLEVRREVAAKLPRNPDVRRELAGAHARLGEAHFQLAQMAAAKKQYADGLAVLTALAAERDKSAGAKADLAAMHGRLGAAQLRTGDIDAAVKNTEEGKALAVALHTADPRSAKAQRDLALARELHGDALLAAGRTAAGVAEYAAAKTLRTDLSDADKESAGARLDLARGLERMGDGRLSQNDPAGAIAAFTESVDLRRAAAAKDTKSSGARRDLAVGLYKLADARCGSGRPALAAAPAAEATELFVQLAAEDKTSAQAKRDLALAYGKWGQVLTNGGHATGALIVWQSALDRCERLAQDDKTDKQAQEDEAAAWERLAGFYAARGNTERALAAARKAIDLWAGTVSGADGQSKAGSRRLALAMIRCGDINIEVRQWGAAHDWYTKAAAAAGTDARDPLLGPVAKLAARQQVYARAVQLGVGNPTAASKLDKDVSVAALRTIAKLELRADRPTSAGAAADELAALATTREDTFAAALTYAECAANAQAGPKAREARAADAVKYLKLAIAAGFRDADALTGPEWDAVGKFHPEFADVRAALLKRNEMEK